MAKAPASFRPGGAGGKRAAWQTRAATVAGGAAEFVAVRPTPRIRGRKGQAIRAAHLAGEPLCRMCRAEGKVTIAVMVDHITPLAEGGAEAPENRQSLCGRHDKDKTAADVKRGQRRWQA